MAKQPIDIGTSANDGTGDALRVAFDKTNDNFNEIYADDFVTTARIADDAITEAHLDATNAAVDNYVLSYDSASSGFTWVPPTDGDITGIVAGDGLTGDATSGDASLAVGAGTGITVNADDVQISDGGVDTLQLAADAVDGTKIADDSIDSEHYIDGSIDTAHIADDQITHAKLEGRYTEIQDIATTTGTIALDASSYAAFNLTGALGTATLDIQNIKTGQVIDIILSGSLSSAVITLSASTFTTVAINKVGSTSLDTAATNILQVLCVDDTDADAILTWAVASYASGTSV
jgi:hypothetical protein